MRFVLNDNSFLGPAAPELGWVPAPRYLMRRARVRVLFETLNPGRLLEVGPGAGALLVEASYRGHKCEALETSIEARNLTTALLRKFGVNASVHSSPENEWSERFDTLCSFEVLEHIDDDQGALSQWRSWLKPGGILLLSVPAKMRLWTAGDEWAGHFRRYEKDALLQLLDRVGFSVQSFECYGFPLTNLSERLSAPAYVRRMRHQNDGVHDSRRSGTDRSGIDRAPHIKMYPVLDSIPGRLLLRFFFLTQAIFNRTNLGSGYLLKAQRI